MDQPPAPTCSNPVYRLALVTASLLALIPARCRDRRADSTENHRSPPVTQPADAAVSRPSLGPTRRAVDLFTSGLTELRAGSTNLARQRFSESCAAGHPAGCRLAAQLDQGGPKRLLQRAHHLAEADCRRGHGDSCAYLAFLQGGDQELQEMACRLDSAHGCLGLAVTELRKNDGQVKPDRSTEHHYFLRAQALFLENCQQGKQLYPCQQVVTIWQQGKGSPALARQALPRLRQLCTGHRGHCLCQELQLAQGGVDVVAATEITRQHLSDSIIKVLPYVTARGTQRIALDYQDKGERRIALLEKQGNAYQVVWKNHGCFDVGWCEYHFQVADLDQDDTRELIYTNCTGGSMGINYEVVVHSPGRTADLTYETGFARAPGTPAVTSPPSLSDDLKEPAYRQLREWIAKHYVEGQTSRFLVSYPTYRLRRDCTSNSSLDPGYAETIDYCAPWGPRCP
ncbi:hypothetical protein ACFL51_00065 [Myxococcota bacterium]